ncbi:MAG: flagellar L-ring protein precursor FlgH, partial [Flavobacteriales bacterium]
MIRLPVYLFALALFVGCSSGPNQIAAYEPRVRDYQLPMEVGGLTRSPEEGSLWSGPDDVNYLYTDHRAIRIGDLLTVRVEEFANAQRNASTQVSRDSELNAQITAFLGVMEGLQSVLPAGADPTEMLGAQSGSSFSGGGGTNRSEQLQATVQVMVRQVLPNGNLFVEGHRVI